MGRLDDLLSRREVENQAALAEAEAAAAASGKELFDLARLEQLLEAEPGSYAEHEGSLRRSYYLLQGPVKTMADFAQHVREMQLSGFWE